MYCISSSDQVAVDMTDAHTIPDGWYSLWFPRVHWSWWANAILYEQQKNTAFMRAQRIMLPPSVEEFNSSSLIIRVRLGHDSSTLVAVGLNHRSVWPPDFKSIRQINCQRSCNEGSHRLTGHTTI